ncbi:MAG: ABC transporter permease [Actinomycetales bacterium]|jgi:ABC-2 type transport system permease protein|nr:ABC transporter permease [Actinomycetales bacterium]
MSTLRLVAVGWWLQLKMRSRSSFDGLLSIVYPMFFATTIFFMYRENGDEAALVSAAVGASCMGVWSAVSTTASTTLQGERRQGTLELLVGSPTSFSLVIVPATVSMATIGLWSLVATLLWGRVVFGIPISFDQPLVFVVAALVLAFSLGLVGFLQAVSSVRYRSAWALGSLFEFPVWLICGFLVPLSILPDWVRPISWLLPPTWGVAAVRDAALGGNAWPDIALCLLTGAAYAVIGVVLARRLVDSARVNATLALT